MDRVAVFVDAGYLFAQGSVALSGQKLPRGNLLLDPEKAVAALEASAKKLTGLPLLRVYWYDGTSTGPTSQHSALAHLSGLKMRLGFVNSVGEQKGVDSLIVTDMIDLARNRAMSDAVLLSGDEDLRVGVQQAQGFGVRVHLIGIKPSRGSQSLFLLQEADKTVEWSPEDLQSFLSVKKSAAEPAAVIQAAESASTVRPVSPLTALREVAGIVAAAIEENELEALVLVIRQSGQTPKEIDGQLLAKSRTRLSATLDSAQKAQVRKAFMQACETRLAAKSGSDKQV